MTSARVHAREWRANDAANVWELVQDQDTLFGPPGLIASLQDAEAWVEQELADQAAPERIKYRFALHLIDGGALIGGCRVHWEDVRNRMASIGMALHGAYWGRGYGTEVGELVLTLAFERLNVHRIEALIQPSNARSLALVRRAGFTKEGLLRERILDATWIDTEVWSLLDHEWRARIS